MKKSKLFIGLGASLLGALLIGSAQVQSAAAETGVSYRTHVQNVGWQPFVSTGAMSGTTGRALRLEGIEVKLTNPEYAGGISYRTHVQNIGWQGFLTNGATSGTTGKALRLEGIEIKLTGELANHYDVQYRTHVQNIGWQPFVANGTTSGTTGKSLRLEGIEIKLVKKASNATQPSTPATPSTPSTPATPTVPNNRVAANRLTADEIECLSQQLFPSDIKIDAEGYMVRVTTGYVFRVDRTRFLLIDDENGDYARYTNHGIMDINVEGWKDINSRW